MVAGVTGVVCCVSLSFLLGHYLDLQQSLGAIGALLLWTLGNNLLQQAVRGKP